MAKFAAMLLMFACLSATGQDTLRPVQSRWSYNTASLVPKGKWEMGIAQPLRIGLRNHVELHTHLVEFILLPEIGVKIGQGSHGGFVFASDHTLSYPTQFLKSVSIKGTGGLISPQFHFGNIFAFSNSLIVSRPMAKSSVLTATAGFVFALRSQKPDPQSTIDLPYLYPRMAHYYQGTSIRLGGNYKGKLLKKLFFEEGVQAFVITRSENNFFFENSGWLMISPRHWIGIKGGYLLTYGKYPFGPLWQLWPTVDVVIGSKR